VAKAIIIRVYLNHLESLQNNLTLEKGVQMKNLIMTISILMISQMSFAASMIDRVDGETFFRSADSLDCAIHIEKVSDHEIASSNVISSEMYNHYGSGNDVWGGLCSASTLVRTCDKSGRCFLPGESSPTLWLLPDGNILSYRTNGDTYKFYPSSSRQYFWY
jgi:hypothetical protein